jgi:hypothetical protein
VGLPKLDEGTPPPKTDGRRECLVAQDQKLARIFGVPYLVTLITSIPALALSQPILDDRPGYVIGGASVLSLEPSISLYP